MQSYIAEVELLLADLRHLVRWYDQLGPADIQRAEATVALVTQLITTAPVNNGADSPMLVASAPLAGRLAAEARQFWAGYVATPSASMVDHLALLLAVIDAEATRRANHG